MICKNIALFIVLMNGISISYSRPWFTEETEKDSEDLFEELLDYDPSNSVRSNSNNLKLQANIWSKFEGYYTYEQYFYDKNMNPQYFSIYDDDEDSLSTSSFPKNLSENASMKMIQTFPAIGFANFTVVGSRVYKHNYLIFPTVDNNETNTNSVASAQDSWETSTYHRDGKTINRGGLLGLYTDATQLYGVSEMVYSAIDDRTIYGRGYTKGGMFTEDDVVLTETIFCLDDDCSQISITQDQFKQKREGKGEKQQRPSSSTMNTKTTVRMSKTSLDLRKKSESEWIDQINNAMVEYNVLENHRVPIPMNSDCLNEGCQSFLNEDWWCETDPSCSISSESNGNTSSNMSYNIIINAQEKVSIYDIILPYFHHGMIILFLMIVILIVSIEKNIRPMKQRQETYSKLDLNIVSNLV